MLEKEIESTPAASTSDAGAPSQVQGIISLEILYTVVWYIS